jgi:hypothetical protein
VIFLFYDELPKIFFQSQYILVLSDTSKTIYITIYISTFQPFQHVTYFVQSCIHIFNKHANHTFFYQYLTDWYKHLLPLKPSYSLYSFNNYNYHSDCILHFISPLSNSNSISYSHHTTSDNFGKNIKKSYNHSYSPFTYNVTQAGNDWKTSIYSQSHRRTKYFIRNQISLLLFSIAPLKSHIPLSTYVDVDHRSVYRWMITLSKQFDLLVHYYSHLE